MNASRATPRQQLLQLDELRWRFGTGLGAEKTALIRALTTTRLPSASALLRYHEILCFLRAYPDDATMLAAVEHALERFERRNDLIRHRTALADTGVAGTAIHYRFFYPTALWLARRWPDSLALDPTDEEYLDRLDCALPLLVPFVEAASVRAAAHTGKTLTTIRRLAGTARDGTFFVRRLERLPGDSFTREASHDTIDVAYRLDPIPGGPSRTRAYASQAPLVYRTAGPRRDRPDLALELRRPPRAIRKLNPAAGREFAALAREAMITRKRDLDAFSWSNSDDVRLVDDGDGLAFAFIGVQPERRLLLPAVHGVLTLRNRVPIGYIQTDTLMAGSELSFNTFETFRGGEAAFTFARLLAALRHALGCQRFRIEPYQLGFHNEEGLASGAWWFYWKLGFRPSDPAVIAVMERELRAMAKKPAHRSSRATLEQLARGYLYWSATPRLPPWNPPFLHASDVASRRLADAGADREELLSALTDQIAGQLGASAKELARWTRSERLWLTRFAPLLAGIPDLRSWTAAERHAALEVVRAKGGPDEYEYVRRFDAHRRLSRAILAVR